MRRTIVCSTLLLTVLVAACDRPGVSTPPDALQTGSALHDGGPVTEDEKLVAAFIKDNAGDPNSVEWARWGPQPNAEEMDRLIYKTPEKPSLQFIRVRYQAKNKKGTKEVVDQCYGVFGAPGHRRAADPFDNTWGDGWVKALLTMAGSK